MFLDLLVSRYQNPNISLGKYDCKKVAFANYKDELLRPRNPPKIVDYFMFWELC